MSKLINSPAPLAPSIRGFQFQWQKYTEPDFEKYVRCLLDADLNWYRLSGAQKVFETWHEEPEEENDNNKNDLISHDLNNRNKPWRDDDERVERLAWYVLACNYDSIPNIPNNVGARYGIHFDLRRMRHASRKCLYELVESKSYEKWIPYCVFFQKVLAHEHCHAWIEDLVTFANKDWYARNFDSPAYKHEEEALCNTVGYAWALNFLKTTPLSQTEQIEILECLTNWMRGCPDGYKNFQKIEDLPMQSYDLLYGKIPSVGADFHIGITELLRDCYDITGVPIENPIGDYFNFDRVQKQSKIGDEVPLPGTSRYASTIKENCCWRGNRIPIYWHG